MTGYSQGPRRRHKKRRGAATILIICAVCALICVAVVFIIINLSGTRYHKVKLSDGGYLKFYGTVGDNGEPYQGKLYLSDGTTAELDMETGTVTYSNGDIYEGELKNYMKDGDGTLTFSTGDVYTGNFSADNITGTGTFRYSNGDEYEGELLDGKRSGYGTYTWA
ncbi:MAG: hypothetical protein WCQ72_00090, partial [Eubacteriales bacterium]